MKLAVEKRGQGSHNFPTTTIRAVGVISLSAVSGDSIPIEHTIPVRAGSGKLSRPKSRSRQVLRCVRLQRATAATD